MTAAVAAVVLVFSLASMLSLVLKIDVPFSLISTIRVDPVGAVFTEALTCVIVIAYGILNVAFAAPDVSAVDSSEQASWIA